MRVGTSGIFIFSGWELRSGIWTKFYEARSKNMVVTEGLNEIQSKFWSGSSYTAALYVGIINNAGFGSIALGNTAAKIVTTAPGVGDNQWEEFTGYSESTRQALTMGTPVAGALDNSASLAAFTVSSDFTFKGGFIVTASGKGATTGKLIAATTVATQAFTAGQQVRIQYQNTLANA